MNEFTPLTKRRKIHLLPNLITAFGLSCGLFIIFKMTMLQAGEIGYQELLPITGIMLLACFADLLDGAVARALKAESDFGGHFDSLADAISFGVAPSVIILKTLSIPMGSQASFFANTAAMIFSVCGALRLVRFNINTMKAKGNAELTMANKKHFTGMPIPLAATSAVSLNLFLSYYPQLLSGDTQRWVLTIALAILGYFMISRWKFPSIKTLEVKVSFQLVALSILSALLLFYGILHYFAVVFFLFSWGYLIIGWTLSITRKLAGRKSKTLEDFEPESDDEDLEEGEE